MVSFFVFALMAAGIAQALLFSRKQAELNVYTITINTVVSGYLEQMKAMTLDDLASSQIPTVRLESDENGKITQAEDPLEANSQDFTSVIPVDINNTPDRTSDDIRLEIQPIVVDLSNDSERPRFDITLNYRWERPSRRSDDRSKWATGSFRYIRSTVPNL